MRVLGRVERFRDRLQLEVRTLEPAGEADPADAGPRDAAGRGRARRLPRVPRRARSRHPGLRAVVDAVRRRRGDPRRAARAAGDAGRPPRLRGRPARAHRRRGDALPRDGAAASAAARRPAARGGAAARRRPDRASSAARPPSARPRKARLLGHVHLGLRLVEERAARSTARRPRGAPARDRRRTTTRAPPERPRRPSSTTRTSSTRSRRRGRSNSPARSHTLGTIRSQTRADWADTLAAGGGWNLTPHPLGGAARA